LIVFFSSTNITHRGVTLYNYAMTSDRRSLLRMRHRPPAARCLSYACDVIGSLYALQFMIHSTFVGLLVHSFIHYFQYLFVWFMYHPSDSAVNEAVSRPK